MVQAVWQLVNDRTAVVFRNFLNFFWNNGNFPEYSTVILEQLFK